MDQDRPHEIRMTAPRSISLEKGRQCSLGTNSVSRADSAFVEPLLAGVVSALIDEATRIVDLDGEVLGSS